MERERVRVSVVVVVCCLVLGVAHAKPPKEPTEEEILSKALPAEQITKRLERYVPVELGASSEVPATLKPMLAPLLRAADVIDRVFWEQYSPEGRVMLDAISESRAPEAMALSRYLTIHYGPWDWHEDDAPFLGKHPRPPGVGLYPVDLSQRELDAWIAKNPGEFAQLYDPYTVVRRKRDRIVGIPYAEAYKGHMADAAKELRTAADAYRCAEGACPCAGLAAFLVARADAFLSGSYVASEMAWMDTGACPLDVAIGPYEVYIDRLLGLKTAFEAIVYFADSSEGRRYDELTKHHGKLVDALPVSAALRPRFSTLKPSPITIADVLYTSGEARAGFQIRTFVLPNDEAVRKAKGTKNVILRNVARAKFDRLVVPLAARVFDKKTAANVNFESYFDFLLAWNLAHTVVPDKVELADGTVSTPQQQLRARHTFINALQGEAIALLNHLWLLDTKALTRGSDVQLATTYLANLFDSTRLAEASPQTIAKIIVYNYLAQEWVFRYVPRTRTFEVNPQALRPAVRKLAEETLEILARGDYAGAGRMIVQYGIMPPEVRETLAALRDLPVDILPRYTVLEVRQ